MSSTVRHEMDAALAPLKRVGVEMPQPTLEAISRIAEERRFPAGTVLFREGEVSDGFYLLISGRVNFTIASSTGRQKLVGWAEKCSSVGLSELVTDRLHNVSAVTALKTSALFFPKAETRALLKEHPELWLEISRWLCADVQRAYQHKAALLR